MPGRGGVFYGLMPLSRRSARRLWARVLDRATSSAVGLASFSVGELPLPALPAPKAVSFDLDDTLWPAAGVIRRAEAVGMGWFAQHAPAAAEHLREERRAELRRRVLADLPSDDHRRQDLSYLRQQIYHLALQDAGYDPAAAAQAYAAFDAERQAVEPFPDAVAALNRLSQQYLLVAITNGTADVRRIGWQGFFKLSISPSLACAAKPDAAIYHYACAALALDPEQVLHVGDDPLLDVEAARAAGLQVAWINRQQRPWPGPGPEPISFADLTGLVAWLCP